MCDHYNVEPLNAIINRCTESSPNQKKIPAAKPLLVGHRDHAGLPGPDLQIILIVLAVVILQDYCTTRLLYIFMASVDTLALRFLPGNVVQELLVRLHISDA